MVREIVLGPKLAKFDGEASEQMHVLACESIFIASNGVSYDGRPVSALPEIMKTATTAATVAQSHLARRQSDSFDELIKMMATTMGTIGALGGGK